MLHHLVIDRSACIIRASSVGWGSLRGDNNLGYSCQISDGRVLVPPGLSFETVISAHANSSVVIEFSCDVEVFGFLAGTATSDPFNPTLFSVNYNSLGILTEPLQITRGLRVSAGKYVLRCECKNAPSSRHSVWGINRIHDFRPPSLAVFTVGRYSEDQVAWNLRKFTQTLTRQNLMAEICGVGEATRSWYLDKIVDILERVRKLPSSISHVLFSDGTDSFILGKADEILETFNEIGEEFVISMERECWPVRDPEWRETFPHYPDRRRWPNAGGWMGTREGVVRVLEECVRIYDTIKDDAWDPAMERWRRFASFAHDDQWILQLAYLYGNVPIRGDHEFRIFTNFGTGQHSLVDNDDYEVVGKRIRSKPSDTFPHVIHFSGGTWRKCQDQWQAAVGLL